MIKKNKILAIVLSLVLAVTLISAGSYDSDARAAETFSITSPTDNELKAAGYIDIEWTSATSSTVQNYEVYIDGKSVGTTKDTTYEYYTTKVKVFDAYIRAHFTDGTTSDTPSITFAVTKKGLCVNGDMGKKLNPMSMNMGWYYDWSISELNFPAYRDIEFVPMIWGNGGEKNIPSVAATNPKYLLAYNEPDMTGDQGGSNMDLNTAVDNWDKFLGYDFHLGAPAPAYSPSWDNGTWFRDFMEKIDSDTIDFIPLHCYYGQYGGAEGANAFLTDVVDKTYEMYHKPIWITEFAVSGWGYDNEWARESLAEFMTTVIAGLNERSYVERYSWFSFDTTDGYNGASALWTQSTGELTDLGRIYVNEGNPEGYVAPEPVDPGFTYTESTRNTLLPDSVTLKEIACEDYVNAEGVSTRASSSINGTSGADKAIDNNIESRWESEWSDPQSITIDLGVERNIKQIDLIWQYASARDFTVEISTDGDKYIPVAYVAGASLVDYRYDSIVLKQMVSGRYVKINATARTTEWGYSIFDIAIYGTTNTDVNETTKAPETTSESETTMEDTTIIVENSNVKLEGYQINWVLGGSRVIGSVEPEINGKKVVHWGFVYALIQNGTITYPVADDDIYVGVDNKYVASFESTDAGTIVPIENGSESATYFTRTMLFAHQTVSEYNAQYKVRTYALLDDGSYLYSNIGTYSVYEVADNLYQTKQMGTSEAHDYLYNTILKVVNPDYEKVDYDWRDSVVK